MPVLVVGATRILRPAVLTLSESDDVFALARSESDLAALAADRPGVVPLPADWTHPDAVAAALADRTIDSALLYCPGAPLDTLRQIAARVSGPVVHVLTSSAARPGADPAPPPSGWHRLQLGWTGSPARWHTPGEISSAALDALRSRQDAVLGRLRPWDERPT